MATANSNSKRPVVVSSALFNQNLHKRVINNAYPRHLQIGIHFGPEISMHFHTAGTEAIWEISVTEAVKNRRLVQGMSPDDALQLGLYYQKQLSKSRFTELNDEINELTSKVKELS